ncbi:hydrolase, alpha/beta fold family [Metarhizium album ARSEF 1941]|uniref:alcohol O-acetyltransferase n=1 Tax=Metarhizium album (strain ARSEF 1941) TaxID=1081103 RepID=A0A0B2WYU9_METAS|nr:hydrolase, alpha/beta fold family [Metarhizium album ARSEF 1941]KHO01462.1 hydrolase, alpha/beta fold family [Metarhizium album ARSEF 1941]
MAMEWFGHAKVEFTHAPAPRAMRAKDGKKTDLLKIVEDSTPPCRLNPLLFNGHIQTMWTATKPSGPPVYYRRRIFDADHKTYKGTFAVDFAVQPFEEVDETLPRRTAYYTDEEFDNIGSDDCKPMLVVLHGLSGGSFEVYLRHTIAPLLGAGGWEVCVVNSRGCARSNITSGVLYNARATWDCRQTVKWLKKTFPNRPLFGLGFSLGANMLTNVSPQPRIVGRFGVDQKQYCGEEGEDCILKGAVVCSNPFNLEITSKILQNRFIGREVYLRAMGCRHYMISAALLRMSLTVLLVAMRNLITTHKEALKKYTDLDLPTVEKVTYLHDFDREVQCPTWGYPTEDAYYRDASSTDAVLNIRIPFIAVQATDDPIAVKEALPFAEFRRNPNTVMITTSMGGHLCWFEMGGSRWHPKPVCNFLNHLAFKIDLDSITPSKTPTREDPKHGADYNPMRRKLLISED